MEKTITMSLQQYRELEQENIRLRERTCTGTFEISHNQYAAVYREIFLDGKKQRIPGYGMVITAPAEQAEVVYKLVNGQWLNDKAEYQEEINRCHKTIADLEMELVSIEHRHKELDTKLKSKSLLSHLRNWWNAR